MKLFSLFKKQKEAAVDNRKAPEILRDVISLIPDIHASNRYYQQSEEFLAHNEWGLALESLVELATHLTTSFQSTSGLSSPSPPKGCKCTTWCSSAGQNVSG